MQSKLPTNTATLKAQRRSTRTRELLCMAPALFRASQLGLPIVMTVESPLGSHDHVHAMSLRDCGWVQLYPCDDQDAVDTHIQAFRIAETLSLPVMVCTDFFQEARATDHLQVPSGVEIDAFLERSDSGRRANPIAADETSAPHTEMRYLAHVKQGSALSTIRHVAAEFRARFGRRSGGFLATHQLYAAKLAVVGPSSTFEVITAAVDRLRRQALGHLEELTFLDVSPTVAVGRPRNR